MDEIKYFQLRTDDRLQRIEDKIDKVLSKYWLLVGMATAISSIASLLMVLWFGK